jgi:hypothetical protein
MSRQASRVGWNGEAPECHAPLVVRGGGRAIGRSPVSNRVNTADDCRDEYRDKTSSNIATTAKQDMSMVLFTFFHEAEWLRYGVALGNSSYPAVAVEISWLLEIMRRCFG